MKYPANLKVFIGYDERESIAYHVACQSIIENTNHALVSIIPLRTTQLREAGIYSRAIDPKSSNAFSYTRFLVPYLSNYSGTSVYLDPDVIVKGDILQLISLSDVDKPVSVVQHNYKPKLKHKYFGAEQYVYPRKNWSSVMVFRNSLCQSLDKDYINKASGEDLHRFKWTEEVGSLPKRWNWLVGEYPENDKANLLHYTNGIPAIHGFDKTEHAGDWWEYHNRAQRARK